MAIITKRISLDVSKLNYIQAIAVKQNDNLTRFLRVQITDNGTNLFINNSAQAMLNVHRSDGERRGFLCEINDDGTITVTLPYWLLKYNGHSTCDISIIENGGRLSTMNFIVYTEESNYTGDVVEDDERYDLLTELLTDVGAVSGEARTAASDAKRAIADVQDQAEQVKELQEKYRTAYIAYSCYADGTDYTEELVSGQEYIGICNSKEAPTDKSHYQWRRFAQPEYEIASPAEVMEHLGDSVK